MILETGMDITERRTAERALHERTAELEQRAIQLRALAAELSQAEERERKRLARVLHDHLQQLLAAAKFATASLKGRVADAGLKAEAQRVLDILDQSIDSSRSLTMDLSPPILHEAGLEAGLLWLVRWMREKHDLHVEVTTSEPPDPLPEDLRLMISHAVRELLFNIVKHAGTQRARVSITHDQERTLRIVVADQGKGFENDPADETALGSFGLFGIRERLAFLGGRMEVETAPGQGARVTLTVPIPATSIQPSTHSPSVMVASALSGIAPEAIRVLVADDHTVVRKGLLELLKKEPGLVIVGEAADGQEALEQAHRIRPNVVLMDVTMPRMDGIEATQRISAIPRFLASICRIR
jgi:glucose-6-phosphate-specific signal transduction histidine kinase